MAKKENGRPSEVSSITTLSSIGIPRDRSARAQKLANVPEDQFEAALQAPKPLTARFDRQALEQAVQNTGGLALLPYSKPETIAFVRERLAEFGIVASARAITDPQVFRLTTDWIEAHAEMADALQTICADRGVNLINVEAAMLALGRYSRAQRALQARVKEVESGAS